MSESEDHPLPEQDDLKLRYELAKLSYDEVLDATKHQDDKVGRFLTAVSFLTAAAIAFGARQDVLQVQYDIDGLVPLPAVLFAAFFALVVISVVFLLMALGQALGLPRGSEISGERSRLFFVVISDYSLKNWQDRWRGRPDDIRDAITENLIGEAHNLAARADKKYRRTGEAQGIFTVALLFFGLALALAINVLSTQAAAPAPWDLRSRLIATSVLTSFAVSLGYSWVRWKQEIGSRSLASYGVWWLASLLPAATLLPPYVVSAATGAVVAGAIAFGAGACASVLVRKGIARGVALAIAWAFAAATAVSVCADADRWRLGLACAALVFFEVPRFLSATFTWRKRAQPGEGPAG